MLHMHMASADMAGHAQQITDSLSSILCSFPIGHRSSVTGCPRPASTQRRPVTLASTRYCSLRPLATYLHTSMLPILLQSGPDRPWQLSVGPFPDDYFASLPEQGWQLLVNGVDREVPSIADLLSDFDFAPRWRADDVMISFAAPGGSIGPHSDSFDVFLLQGSGEKRWSVATGAKVDPDDADAHEPVRSMLTQKRTCDDISCTRGPSEVILHVLVRPASGAMPSTVAFFGQTVTQKLSDSKL
jgi:hypothetical protein